MTHWARLHSALPILSRSRFGSERRHVGPLWARSHSAYVPCGIRTYHASQCEKRVGGGGNVAANIATLGGDAIVVGPIGNHENGDRLNELFKARRCRGKLIKLCDGTTITKLRVLIQHQRLIRLDFERAFGDHGQIDLYQALTNTLKEVAVQMRLDYAKGTAAAPEALIDIERKRSFPIVVDPRRSNIDA